MEGEYEPQITIAQPTSVTHLADGSVHVEGRVHSNFDVSDNEVKEVIAGSQGLNPDEVHVGRTPEEVARRAGAGSRAFFSSENWKSTWDPKADPNLN